MLLSDAHAALVPGHGQCVHVIQERKAIVAAEEDQCAICKRRHGVAISSLGVAPSLFSDAQFTDVPEVHNHSARYSDQRTNIMVASSTSVSRPEEKAA